MSQITVADYIDWAVDKIVSGYDSPNLRMLSGLDSSGGLFEAEFHFGRSLNELGIVEPDRAGKFKGYAIELAQQILEEQLSLRDGVNILYRICVLLDYAKEFMIWLELDDAIEDIKTGGYPHSYSTMTAENFENIVRSEAEKFLESAKNNFLPKLLDD